MINDNKHSQLLSSHARPLGSTFEIVFNPSAIVTFFHFNIVPTERSTIQKERAAGMYRLSAYYFAKLVSELPVLLLQPLILYFITYWATGLNRSPYFLVSVLTIATGAFLSQVSKICCLDNFLTRFCTFFLFFELKYSSQYLFENISYN